MIYGEMTKRVGREIGFKQRFEVGKIGGDIWGGSSEHKELASGETHISCEMIKFGVGNTKEYNLEEAK